MDVFQKWIFSVESVSDYLSKLLCYFFDKGNHMLNFSEVLKETIAVSVLSLVCAFAAHATEQAEQRQEARDVRQDARSQARHDKRECKHNDEKSDHECREEKRGAKQDGRQKARDIKY